MLKFSGIQNVIIKSFLILLTILAFSSESSANENAFLVSVTPDTGVAKQIGTWQVKIVCTQETERGSTFKLLFAKGILRDLNEISASNDFYGRFIKFSCSNPGVKINPAGFESTMDANISFWEKDVHNRIITFKMAENSSSLLVGDTIIVSINAQLSTKVRAHETASNDQIELCFAPRNSTTFTLQKSFAPFTIRPFLTSQLYIYARSIERPGKPVLFQVISNDIYNNLTSNYIGRITLNITPSTPGFPREVIITPADSGRKEFYVVFPDSGIYYISGASADNIPVYPSNPVWITPQQYNVYWGDLHSHGDESRDGIGVAKFDYAKYTRGLDFFTPTDHCDHGIQISGISDAEWANMKADVLRLNEPGRFVPFLGYENSYNSEAGGHYNIYFNFRDEDIDGLPLWPRKIYPNILSIWGAADSLDSKYEVMTLPHHCGKIFNVNIPNDPGSLNFFGGKYFKPKYKPAIEILSTHGLSESYNPTHNLSYENKSVTAKSADGPHYAQDAWVIGEKLGVVAGSDDHIAHPGVSSNGLTAVVSNDVLSRNTVFKSIQQRSSYATTGERMIVQFSTGDSISIGNEAVRNQKYIPKFNISIIGTDSLDYAELLKWDSASGKIVNGHPAFEIVKKWNFNEGEKFAQLQFNDPYIIGNSIYYFRVKQKNIVGNREVWAWTSPLWIQKPIDSFPPTDSLINFKVNNNKIFENEAFAEILNQKNFKQYQLVRKNIDELKTIATISAIAPEINKSVYTFNDLMPQDGINHYTLYGKNDSSSSWKQLAEDSVANSFDKVNLFNVLLNDENRIEMQWTVANEFHVQDYQIENSLDSLQFFPVKMVIPTGIRKPSTSYSESFNSENKPFVRLTLVMQNGKKIYYNARVSFPTGISTQYSKLTGLELMNNFIQNGKDKLQLKYSGSKALQLSVSFFDIQGKQVAESQVVQCLPGQLLSVDTPSLPSGIYFIECTSGQNSITFKYMLNGD